MEVMITYKIGLRFVNICRRSKEQVHIHVLWIFWSSVVTYGGKIVSVFVWWTQTLLHRFKVLWILVVLASIGSQEVSSLFVSPLWYIMILVMDLSFVFFEMSFIA